jgi:hypothetical protein
VVGEFGEAMVIKGETKSGFYINGRKGKSQNPDITKREKRQTA